MSQALVVNDVVLQSLPQSDALAIGEAFRRLEGRIQELERRAVQWYGEYDSSMCYQAGSMVLVDRQYLAIANVNTCASPEIIPVGESGWVSGIDDAGTGFVYTGATWKIKKRGQEYRLTQGKSYLVSGVRFFVPHDQATQSYSIAHSKWVPGGGTWQRNEIVGRFFSTAKGTWLEYDYADLWLAGETHRIHGDVVSETGVVNWNGWWVQVNTNDDPVAGQVAVPATGRTLKFHYTDNNSVNQKAQLDATPIGAEITDGTFNWIVTDAIPGADFITYEVSPAIRGATGLKIWAFSYGAAADLWHANVLAHWSGNPDIDGIFENDNNGENVGTNQFMADVKIQEIYASPDWTIISLR